MAHEGPELTRYRAPEVLCPYEAPSRDSDLQRRIDREACAECERGRLFGPRRPLCRWRPPERSPATRGGSSLLPCPSPWLEWRAKRDRGEGPLRPYRWRRSRPRCRSRTLALRLRPSPSLWAQELEVRRRACTRAPRIQRPAPWPRLQGSPLPAQGWAHRHVHDRPQGDEEGDQRARRSRSQEAGHRPRKRAAPTWAAPTRRRSEGREGPPGPSWVRPREARWPLAPSSRVSWVRRPEARAPWVSDCRPPCGPPREARPPRPLPKRVGVGGPTRAHSAAIVRSAVPGAVPLTHHRKGRAPRMGECLRTPAPAREDPAQAPTRERRGSSTARGDGSAPATAGGLAP